MPPRSRYAVDPSLVHRQQPPPQQQYQQPQHVQQQQPTTGPYQPTEKIRSYTVDRPTLTDTSPQPSLQPAQPLNHIPPPPHSAGPALSGPRVRIDPSQVPNPVEAQELDQNLWDEEDFESCHTRGLIPLAGTDYRGIDQGNSLPRHVRSTLGSIPANSQLLDTTALPLGIIVQPLAQLRYDEAPIPLVSNWSSGESAFVTPEELEGPPRCEKCRGYINPFVRWQDGGRSWLCNLCGQSNTVANSYFSPITPTGQRADHSERPELLHGTIDISVPRPYWATREQAQGPDLGLGVGTSTEEAKLRKPEPVGRVFILDVSRSAVQRGVLQEVCRAIRQALFEQEEDVEGKVAIVTVGETVGFWNLQAPQASQMVVGDLEDMYVPLHEGFLVDPQACRPQIEGLLQALPEMDHGANACALGAAVKGALAGLRKQGGHIVVFSAGLPTINPGKLSAREGQLTSDERAMFAPEAFWRSTADEVAECGVGFSTFFFPDQYTDVASVGAPSAVAGGESFFYPRFDPVRDRVALQQDVEHLLSQEIGYNATLRIRCSQGLRVSEHVGNIYPRSLTDIELGIVDESTALGAVLQYEGRLDEREQAYIQVALLYTSATGDRRVRLFNLQLSVTSLIGNVFRFADLDAVVTLFAKHAVSLISSKNLRDIKTGLTARCNRVLLMYRRHCAAGVQAGQLILPESLKLLPLYTLCINKTKALKGGSVTSDVRILYARRLRSAGITATMSLLYPRIMAIHDLSEDVAFAGVGGRLKLPAAMRASYGWMVAEGSYLMINGEVAMLWLGAAVSPQILDDLWGVDALEEIDTRMTRLPKLPTLLSTQVRNLLTHYERIHGRGLALTVVRQNMDGMEIEYANALVEDSNNDGLGYTDYLMTAHKSITNELSGGGKGDWRPW